jgi:hypothetical protein
MIVANRLTFGNTPVPYTVSWTGEDRDWHVGSCPFSQCAAICQAEAPGVGTPLFNKPHSQRQRRTIALGLCDLCAKPLKGRTKVSLSHARPYAHARRAGDILQFEPLLHRECAAISARFCPSLRKQLKAGVFMVRRVTRYDVQFAVMDEVYTETMTGQRCKAVGHAKVQLLDWVDLDEDWLVEGATA